MIGAALGYRVTLLVAANVSEERKKIVRAYGAELVLSDPLKGSDGAILKARDLAGGSAKYFYADQHNNAANWRVHYETTAPEIWQQTRGLMTHLVAGVWTSGTLMGTGASIEGIQSDD